MRNIPFSPPDITEAEINAVAEVLRSGWITTGPRTKLFEQKIYEYSNAAKAVCLSSQTACAEMCLRVLGVGPGDEVILPAYTYTATASIVYHVGATPVLIDCKENSYQMDYDKMEAAINEKTKVIIPVDLAGIVCDYDRVFAAVENKKHLFKPVNAIQEGFGRVIVMADAAHAFGAQKDGKMCGEIADFTNFSFHAVKNMTSAEGGAAVWKNHKAVNSDELYKQFMLFSLHGQTKDAYQKNRGTSWEYDVVDTQYKCNMPDILAAVGLAQFERYESMIERRHQLIEFYNNSFATLPIQVLNHKSDNHRSSGHLYFVRFLGQDSDFRNTFFNRMAQNGISCNVHFKPLPMFTAYKKYGFNIADFPNAYNMHKNQLTLPLNTTLTDADAEYVADTFKRCIAQQY
ncbi:MAG: DegT/DnrJ/EryC1/StrS aminotransferase family protein [Oscillospiraceae bacterium]|nr:DegT/DnrJ/EryC1/StrS aminotransferase family protein [Oscillospiraceae bacterium]